MTRLKQFARSKVAVLTSTASTEIWLSVEIDLCCCHIIKLWTKTSFYLRKLSYRFFIFIFWFFLWFSFLFIQQTVGCDGVINGQRYDACGVCGGDNSTCKLISGLYTKPQLASGYNYITEIPQQACNLSIADLKKTANLLGKSSFCFSFSLSVLVND